MNLFVVEITPEASATSLCDKHVVKMPTESGQMLSHYLRTVHAFADVDLPGLAKSHHSHPVVKWTMLNNDNAYWHFRHFRALLAEYTSRYNKIHAYQYIADLLSNYLTGAYSEPKYYAVCVHDDCIAPGVLLNIGTIKEAVDSYRKDYHVHKSYFAVWKHGNVPLWYNAT